MLFKSILVALGEGGASRVALREAVDMARAAHAKITAIFVVDHHLAVGDVILEISEERIFRSFLHEEAERELRHAKDLFSNYGVDGDTLMIDASGEPVSDVICRIVSSTKADVVVVERHDPTALERIFGGVADKVLYKANVPVLLVSDCASGDA
ncbi:universal stress protein [Paraburkholderia sp. A3BS-1L]|uniref:universal stress protein n=1 Tax=Paraburkholderia sp. A3BS-1L TaxID=3028375 RepID=UPI003DA97E6B